MPTKEAQIPRIPAWLYVLFGAVGVVSDALGIGHAPSGAPEVPLGSHHDRRRRKPGHSIGHQPAPTATTDVALVLPSVLSLIMLVRLTSG